MYILENAITSIIRNKGRNLLIGMIILVIASATAVTLAIHNSSNDLIDSYASKYEIEATIGINRENMMGGFDPNNRDESKENMKEIFSKVSEISIEDILKYGDSDYVKNYYYTITTGVNANNLEATSTTNSDEKEFGRKPSFDMQKVNGDFTLKGYSTIEAMNEFIEGKYTITSGSVSEDFESNDCLINNELATLNNLKVNDTIEIVDSEDETKTYTLTISGIFEEKEDSNNMSMFTNSANTIITNVNMVEKMKENNTDLEVSNSSTFILTNSDVIDDFESELRTKGLDENLKVETNLEQIEGATSTISNVKNFAITFLIITLIIGTVVLLVINMINIRERKYEIGVLRTIGMKKSAVSLQFVSELLIVSIVFLLLGAGIGAIISVPVSNHLLNNEISASNQEKNKISENFGFKGQNVSGQNKPEISKPNRGNFKGVTEIQAYDSIDAAVDIKVLLELLGIGLLITFISASSAMISIQKFSPLTILKERS